MHRTVFALLLGLALIFGCSDDDGVDLEELCKTACGTKQPNCTKWYTTCLNSCKTVSADSDRKYISGCGACVAKSFTYYEDPTTKECLGPQNKTATDKECLKACYLPDGGLGY